MVELAHIFLLNATSKCGQLRKFKMLKRKVKLNKLPKEKFQLERNDWKYLNNSLYFLSLMLQAHFSFSYKIKFDVWITIFRFPLYKY